MKKFKNSKILTTFIAISALFCCFNGSVVNSTTSTSTEPDVNFYGTLEDHTHTGQIESILIGGKYESIPVYQPIKPATYHDKNITAEQDMDPKQNKVLINLQDIASISLHHPESPTKSSVQLNGKNFVTIIVESLHGTKKKYLIEANRKITCTEIEKKSTQQDTETLGNRDLSFIHIKKLTIKGYKAKGNYQAPAIQDINETLSTGKASMQKIDTTTSIEDKNKFKNNAAELLTAIEENVKNMPTDNPSAFKAMQSTILTLLKTLRDQLQKFLDMIK